VLVAALVYLRRQGEVPLGGRLFLCEIGVLVAAACSAVNYWWFTPRVKAVQQQLAARYGAFSRADKTDPLVARFNGLHATSTTVFVLGLAAALVCLVCVTHFRSRHPGPGPASGTGVTA
jgi:hypothetical protein